MIRILVAGSRTWTFKDWIADELDSVVYAAGIKNPADVTLVSGACPRGADRIAEEHATMRGWTVERYPADWTRYGRRAGFVRNQAMVDLGADVCVIFVRDGSAGATHTGRAAEKAGIPTRWNEAM